MKANIKIQHHHNIDIEYLLSQIPTVILVYGWVWEGNWPWIAQHLWILHLLKFFLLILNPLFCLILSPKTHLIKLKHGSKNFNEFSGNESICLSKIFITQTVQSCETVVGIVRPGDNVSTCLGIVWYTAGMLITTYIQKPHPTSALL